MKTVSRYLSRQILAGLALATAVLLPLFAFLDLLDQLDDVGQGTYRIEDAFVYVILLLPRRFIELAPFIALMGNVMALGRLAVNHELTSMRAAGMSPAQIGKESLRVGLLLVLVILAMEQYLAPSLQQEALLRRTAALEQSAELGQDLGTWSRDEGHILRIGSMLNRDTATDIEILRLDSDGFLETYTFAARADIISDEEWRLHDVVVKTFEGQDVTSRAMESSVWKPFLDSGQIATLMKPPESLSPLELFRYVQFLRSTGQEADAYSLALWRKGGGMLTTIAMLLLSVPFVFGSVRGGLGSRLVLAGLTGLGIYLLDQITANIGLLLDLNPAVIALLPGLLLILIGSFWLQRVA